MRRRRDHDGDRLVERVLARIAAGIAPPTEDELRRRARLAATPREPSARPASDEHRPWRPMRLRWTLGVAALILLATALGFGVGTWLTPSGSARNDLEGLGFLPAKGWTVVQSGTAGGAASARAVAANVPLDPADRAEGTPLNTLRTLPREGVVIVATLTTRGDPATDARFPLRVLPLRFVDATAESDLGEPTASQGRVTRYSLRAGVGGYNVDARIYFGSRPPSVSSLQAADEQLQRLVVSADQVTLAVRPTVAVPFRPMTAYGSVSSGKAEQKVTLQFKQCGLYPVQYRDVAEATTSEGGGWSAAVGAGANGTFRATLGDAVSNEVKVLARTDVRLSPMRSGQRFRVYVVEQASFWHRHVFIERFDRARGRWVRLMRLVLEDAFAAPGSVFVWSATKKFAVKVAKRTTIRAVLPLDQARPCHIAGYSNLLTT